MKKYFIYIFCIITSITSAQESLEFLGMIKLNDSSLISYKIFINELHGIINGYSITDAGGEHETRSEIIGTYNKKNKNFNFKETSIVYTKSPVSQDDFCFINFSTESFALGRANKIKGKFKGLFSDNTECISGELAMIGSAKIDKKVKRVTKFIERSKRIPDSTKKKINLLKMMDSLNMNILRKNQVLTVFSQSENIELIIFDGGKEDGDKVSIYVNDDLILDRYEIVNTQKKLIIPLRTKKTRLKIIAITDGAIAPNTMSIKILDNNKELKVLSNLKKGDSAILDFLKN